MSENKHTPEPLTFMALPTADGEFMVLGGVGQEYGLVASCVKLEDARRIVACVNACAGMDDPQSELDQLRQRVAELEALSVTRIMLSVSPGEDGNGQEIYAKSVDDVVEVLTKIDTENERLEAENARLKTQLAEAIRHESENLTLLVASQLREKQLREAFQTYIDEHEECMDADDWMAMTCSMEAHHVANESIALPQDDSALREYLAARMKPLVEALDNFLVANDPSEFGCACDPGVGHVCGPCRTYERQTPLRKALEAARKELS